MQVNTLIYTMGDRADDILRSLTLTAEDRKKYDKVKERFNEHFVGKRNVIYERVRFNMRRQEEGESVDMFITALYELAEHCGYGELNDEMLRDRIVVGIRNSTLAEKLQLDPKLTLESAILQARQSEVVKSQQSLLRGEVDIPVGAVRKGSGPRQFLRDSTTMDQKQPGRCTRCGRFPAHDRSQCPARDAICRKCKKRGHYQFVCKSAREGGVNFYSEEGCGSADAFLGTMNKTGFDGDPWTVTLRLDGTPVQLHIDTGAEVTVVTEEIWKGVPLAHADRKLRGPDSHLIQAQGTFVATMQLDKQETKEVFVVKDLAKPLLGRPAIEALNLIQRTCIASIEQSLNPKQQFPSLFQGLGKLEGDYMMRLQDNAEPYAISTPRRVAIPLQKLVKQELERMEQMGVIGKVEQSTEWCVGMVVVPKANGRVRICVDLTKLNESVQRERHLLPAVDQTLAQLAGAKIFTKLDANSGFWQVPLAPESSLLTAFLTPFGRYCFHRLPFGISSAPEHFQRRM